MTYRCFDTNIFYSKSNRSWSRRSCYIIISLFCTKQRQRQTEWRKRVNMVELAFWSSHSDLTVLVTEEHPGSVWPPSENYKGNSTEYFLKSQSFVYVCVHMFVPLLLFHSHSVSWSWPPHLWWSTEIHRQYLACEKVKPRKKERTWVCVGVLLPPLKHFLIFFF